MMLRHNQSLRVRNDMDVEVDRVVKGRILELMRDMKTLGIEGEREAAHRPDVRVVMVEVHEKVQAFVADTWLRKAKPL
jgi:hypothetical protein